MRREVAQFLLVACLSPACPRSHSDNLLARAFARRKRRLAGRGFLHAQVESEAKVLTSNPVSERVAVTLHVDEGRQYRLSRIAFKNNRALRNPTALRSLLPQKDGEIFKRSVIGQGLENLRRAYLEFGYVNATSVPDTLINDKAGTISLTVEVDEGSSSTFRTSMCSARAARQRKTGCAIPRSSEGRPITRGWPSISSVWGGGLPHKACPLPQESI